MGWEYRPARLGRCCCRPATRSAVSSLFLFAIAASVALSPGKKLVSNSKGQTLLVQDSIFEIEVWLNINI